MKIHDLNASEALFWFVHDNEGIFTDFCDKNVSEELSIAEYVDKYKREDFKTYAHDKFDIGIEYD